MNKHNGILICVSGFAGSGKGTIMKKLMAKYSDKYALSVSATTRKPRPGEEEGREYFFKTKEEFVELIEKGQMLEYANYVGNYYGTPYAYVEEKMNQGYDVILEIEPQGALSVKERYPDTLLLFIMPPDMITLKNRLTGRGTEDEETILKRMAQAYTEASVMERYDYLIINDTIDDCTEVVHSVIQNEHHRMNRNKNLIENVKNDLKMYSKGE